MKPKLPESENYTPTNSTTKDSQLNDTERMAAALAGVEAEVERSLTQAETAAARLILGAGANFSRPSPYRIARAYDVSMEEMWEEHRWLVRSHDAAALRLAAEDMIEEENDDE